jgi:hypothetical protein
VLRLRLGDMGVESRKDLTKRQAGDLIDWLEGAGFRSLMCGGDYDRVLVGDPKYEADDPRDVERERAERDEWLTLLARQLEAAGR